MRNNAGELVRILLLILAISFMKVMSTSNELPDADQPKQEIKPVGRGADTTADKKLTFTQKAVPLLSDI